MLLNFLKKRSKAKQKQAKEQARKVAQSQMAVYRALAKVGRPINGLRLAQEMRTDSASVTPRLSELTRKGLIKVAYVMRGTDGRLRRFYEVKKKGRND